MDSEVSLRHETPCQPRVMEHREDDSTKSGCQVPDRGQEEEYNNPSVSPRTIDLGCGTTSGQSNVIRANELTEGGTFVVEEELEWRGESDGVRDGLDWRRNTLLGGVQEELATRPDAGGVDEEPSGSSMSSMPEPSMGVKYSAEKGQMDKDDLMDSRSLHMEQDEEEGPSDVSSTRRCQEDGRILGY